MMIREMKEEAGKCRKRGGCQVAGSCAIVDQTQKEATQLGCIAVVLDGDIEKYCKKITKGMV